MENKKELNCIHCGYELKKDKHGYFCNRNWCSMRDLPQGPEIKKNENLLKYIKEKDKMQ